MGNRGRKQLVSAEQILHVLETNQYDIWQDNGTLKGKRHPVWQTISDKLHKQIKGETIYLYMTKHYKNIYPAYCEKLGILVDDSPREKVEYIDAPEVESEIEIEPDEEPKKKSKTELVFNITINPDKWNLIKPLETSSSSLQGGWTAIFFDVLWEHFKLACCFNFEHATIRKESHPYITIEANCSDCKAELVAECIDKPENDLVQFEVKIKNFRDILHTKKRRLIAGSEMNKLMNESNTKKPKQVRRELLSDKMKPGDPVPANVPNLPALSKRRQKSKTIKLGIEPGATVWESLSNMKKDPKYGKFIKDIGFDKFFITYHSIDQIAANNEIQDKLRTAVSIDSTGSMVTSLTRPNDTSSELFLHQVVTHIGNIIVPLAQAISEKSDANFFTWWFNELKKSGFVTPHQLVTDLCRALMNAGCMAFNISTLNDYVDNCLMILQKRVDHVKNLNCWLRFDIAHLINAVRKWKCFDSCAHRIQSFYSKCVGLLSTAKTLNDFESTLKDIFTLAGNNVKTNVTKAALDNLYSKLQTYTFDEASIKIKEELSKLGSSVIEEISYSVISNKCSQIDDSDYLIELNDFYLPSFVDQLVDLGLDFPIWSNVMMDHFESEDDEGTSARSEAYFADAKSSILENRMRLRVDKIVAQHCTLIESDLLECSAAIKNLSKPTVVSKKKRIENNEHIEATGNWRGKGNFVKVELPEDSSHFDSDEHFTIDSEVLPHQKQIQSDANVHDAMHSISLDHSYISQKNDDLMKYNSFSTDILLHSSIVKLPESENLDCIVVLENDSDPSVEASVSNNNNLVLRTVFKQEEQSKLLKEKNKSKSRGPMVSKDPDIKIRMQKPSGKISRAIIKNGSYMRKRVVLRKKKKFDYTCAWDTITELLKAGHGLTNDFRNFLTNCFNQSVKGFINDFEDDDINYIKVVVDYATSGCGPRDIFYKKRAYILYTLNDHSRETIQCNTNVNRLFSRLMQPYPGPVEHIFCGKCNSSERRNMPVIAIPSTDSIWRNGYSNLENDLITFMAPRTTYCFTCKMDIATKKHDVGHYICIDVDDVYVDSNQAKKYNIKDFTSDVRQITHYLSIQGYNFLLCGVIKYQPSFDEHGIGHYIAYNRLFNEKWEIRNDVPPNFEAQSAVQKDFTAKLSTILYVRY